MKPFYTKVTTDFDPSITYRYYEGKDLYPQWHFHDEYELVYIHKSNGIRYVGDNIMAYNRGDFVLLGSGLPHTWINSKIKNPMEDECATTVIHFQTKFIHNEFFELPLMKGIQNLFQKSHQGIWFKNTRGIESSLNKINEAHSAKKVSLVINLLHRLSTMRNIELLCSKNFTKGNGAINEKLIKIYNYIIHNYRQKITLEELANLAHMTPQAFSSFFKKRTRKTAFEYINELRIGYSCKLLIERDMNVDQVALKSGFNNTTFYNRKFKEIKCITPKEFRKKFSF